MPCLVGLLALLFPRVVIVVLWLLTTFFQGVYDTYLVPILGFLFLPLTLLAYTWLTKSGQPVDAFYIVVMIVAVAVDLGLIGGSARRRQ